MNRPLARIALVLGLITAGGGLGIDMYLPAFPAIANDLGVEVGEVQMSLVVYLLALGLGQVVYGPLSDRIGRKPPILVGLALFVTASIGCAFSANIEQLIAFRLLQGLGACAGMVVVRAIVRDMFVGAEAIRLQALIMAVVGVSPILSPVLGGVMSQFLAWPSIFWFLAAAGALALCLALLALTETHPRERRSRGGPAETLRTYRLLVRDRRFMGLSLIPGLSQGGTFAFVSSSSFLFIELLGVSPAEYSLIFAANSVAMIGGAQFAAMAVRTFGTGWVIVAALGANTAGALLLAAAVFGGFMSLPLVFMTFLLCFGSLGFIGGPASVHALAPHGDRAGAAAALGGALQMGWGAAGGALVGAFFDGTAQPVATALAAFNTAALFVACLTLSPELPAKASR